MPKGPVPITQHRRRSWGGLTAGIYSVPAGIIEAPPSPHHLVSMHLGAPVQAVCRVNGHQSSRVQEEGDVDVIPAGLPSFWKDEAPVTFLALVLSPALVSDAAEGVGLDPDRAASEASQRRFARHPRSHRRIKEHQSREQTLT